MRKQPDLFAPPVVERHFELPSGMTFSYGGRPLRIVKAYGSDFAAPVIVEELTTTGGGIERGQYALWSANGVLRAIAAGANRWLK